jgi:hypothetical protein
MSRAALFAAGAAGALLGAADCGGTEVLRGSADAGDAASEAPEDGAADAAAGDDSPPYANDSPSILPMPLYGGPFR